VQRSHDIRYIEYNEDTNKQAKENSQSI